MKYKIILLIFLSIFSITQSFAQTYIYYGDKTYGTNKDDFLQSLIDIGNGHLVIAGRSSANVSGDKTDPKCDSTLGPSDVWVLKIDTSYTILWNYSIGGTNQEASPQLLYVNNSSKISVVTTSISDSSCEKSADNKSTLNDGDYWIANMDTNGNMINDFTWGGSKVDQAPQTIVLKSGNYITCGISNSPVSGDVTVANYDSSTANNSTSDFWVVKTDSLGNKLWDKHYGGTGNEFAQAYNLDSQFNLLADGDDNFMIAGTTNSPVSGDISGINKGFYDVWIIKIDSAGNKIWDKRYGGLENDICNHIIQSSDDGYILCGSTASAQGGDVTDTSKGGTTDCWVIKLDPHGNKQWDKRYGGNGDDAATWIEKAPGGGYWVSGQSSSDSSGDVTETRYGIYSDYWIFKIDDLGNKLWDKRYGGPGVNIGSTFVIMPDSSIFLAGSARQGITAVKSDSGKGQLDYWIVHFKYTDTLNLTGIYTLNNFSNNLSVFPNPTKDIVTITSATENIKSVALINLLGENLLEQKVNNARTTQLNLQPYAPGFYFVKITGADYSVVKKVLRQ